MVWKLHTLRKSKTPIEVDMKNIWLVLLLALFVVSCSKKEETIKIGTVLPLTGSAAVWGQNAKKGIELAFDELQKSNEAFAGKIEVIFEDSKSDPIEAVSAIKKLIDINKIQVVIGDIASSNVLAMAPIAEKSKVVLLSPGASNPQISSAGEYIFRNWQSDALEAKVDAQFAFKTLKYRKMAILYVNNAYGVGLESVFVEEFTKLGGAITISEQFKQESTDMRSQLNKIRSMKPDAIYLPGYPPEMAIILKQSKELGIAFPMLSVQAFDDPQIVEIAKEAAEGVIFSIPMPPDTTNTIVRTFIASYRTKFKQEPGVCSNTGYDAFRIVIWALQEKARTGEQIREEFLKLKDFPGAAGLTTFDENGDVVRPFIFMVTKSAKFIPYGN